MDNTDDTKSDELQFCTLPEFLTALSQYRDALVSLGIIARGSDTGTQQADKENQE